MTENNDKTYNIKGIEYTKEDINKSPELKKELYKILNYEKIKENNKLSMRKYRKEHKEESNEKMRIYMRKRYNEDKNFREKVLERCKARNNALLLPELRKPRGRPASYQLDENFNLISVF